MDSHRRRNDDHPNDTPVYSRLFIVCGKGANEAELRSIFTQYGTIEDIQLPCDRKTGESKGVAYVKYSKTSEAAAAFDAKQRRTLSGSSRPMKVMVAANRSDVQTDDDYDKYRRLFIHFDTETEQDLYDHFGQYGHVDQVIIQKDRNTGRNKEFAYVRYRTFTEAAKAFEECNRKYRAIFAQPKTQRRHESSYESNLNSLMEHSGNIKNSMVSLMNVQAPGYTKIMYMCAPFLHHHQLERIFDIVPGMEHCQYFVDLAGNFGKGRVSYSNPISAAYAVEKLNEFEYPPGVKLFVKPDNSTFNKHESSFNNIPNVISKLNSAISNTRQPIGKTPDLAQLAEAIAEASKLIKSATAGISDNMVPSSNDLNYCSVQLPPPQPLSDIDSRVEKRCFLVCKPQPPPLTVLRDIFCRFGHLINVYTLPNKTVGYARYAKASAADEAIKKLHGAEVCGIRIKVLEAEEEGGPSKRTKYND